MAAFLGCGLENHPSHRALPSGQTDRPGQARIGLYTEDLAAHPSIPLNDKSRQLSLPSGDRQRDATPEGLEGRPECVCIPVMTGTAGRERGVTCSAVPMAAVSAEKPKAIWRGLHRPGAVSLTLFYTSAFHC